MNVDAEKRERRSKAERKKQHEKFSPIKPPVTNTTDLRELTLKTPEKPAQKQKFETPPRKFSVACGTPQARRSTPLASPETRNAPFNKEKTPKFPLGHEWPATVHETLQQED